MSAPSPPTAAQPDSLVDIGVVAIGRNEGERLRRCFDALPPALGRVVYVDSASTDRSVEEARRRGIDVVDLDLSIPFTAARARNAGLERLRERAPELEFVQLLDGDCQLAPGWIEAALEELRRDPQLAIVCGRRRELHPDASPYNRLCDMEWDTPTGDAFCGGDALVRVAALREVGGFDGGLIAGEEPELCFRLRARGWRIRRIERDMTFHDAAMMRVGQWWRRAERAGHAYAEVSTAHPPFWVRETRSSLAWGLALPLVAAVAGAATGGRGLALLAGYPILWARVLVRRHRPGETLGHRALYATSCVAAKFAESAGVLRFWWFRSRGRRSRIIEYK